MTTGKPTREQADLAEVLEMVLDKGIVINADIAVTVGDTEMLGIELRAAIASFETAAEYGLAFPSGTDMQRVERASGREPLDDDDAEAIDEGEEIDLGIGASSGGATSEGAASTGTERTPPGRRPDPETMLDDEEADEASEAADGDDPADVDTEDSGPDANADDAGANDEEDAT